nr:helix-turn-helix transcriptional regulator [uncultured Dyadobacter sp.]
MQIKPLPLLSGIVKHFLILETDQAATMRIFSDGNTGLAFNYGDPLFHHTQQCIVPEPLPAHFLYGQLDSYRNVIAAGKIGLLIVVLHPFASGMPFKIPACKLKNEILSLDTFRAGAHSLPDQLAGISTYSDKIGLIENWLLGIMASPAGGVSLAAEAVNLIHSAHGLLTVTQMASTLRVQERQIQRVFEQQIGISPKRYAGITRIQYFLKLLRTRQHDTPLAGLAYEGGFYDQAHLIRELKNISGLTPTQHIQSQNLLAANLIHIPS